MLNISRALFGLTKMKRFNVAEGIRKAAEMLDARTLWLNEAKTEYEAKQYKQALAAFNKVLDLDSNFVEAHKLKGNILLTLDRYEEALAAFDQAIELKPDYMLGFGMIKGVFYINLSVITKLY